MIYIYASRTDFRIADVRIAPLLRGPTCTSHAMPVPVLPVVPWKFQRGAGEPLGGGTTRGAETRVPQGAEGLFLNASVCSREILINSSP